MADTIAFIGLGVMGYPMAVNLRKKMPSSHKLLICDVSKDALARFQSEMKGSGPIEVVSNGAEAVAQADQVYTMLPGSEAVEAVYLDPSTGIIPRATSILTSNPSQRKIIVECGTIETSTILKVAEAASSASSSLSPPDRLTFADAPVSGGPMGAEKGTLTFMVGVTAKPSFPAIKEVLSTMGPADAIFLCGDVGAGTAFKIINNYLSAITSLAASEALNIGAKMNLDLKLLTDVINVSGGQCWVTSKSNPVPGVQENVPSSRGYENGFRIELCKKVLGMGSRLAEMVGARTVLDRPTLEAFEEAAADERYKGKDARVVYKWLNESEVRRSE
ncbi:3-hydroxyisobutyrate dehydrogenase [Elsinoe ampelina]|uniref:3-hydroxyisobutyrate dehydrogenase n=1 Tax=Elsinoe ampelina TaxID=302913 RepID=A0A6A6G6W6_9PEZI|nr:3-hydroxyisobutyrate dehydrogenase [Elsinoe ampelina]